MNLVYACIDGRTNTTAVIDAAIWSARRLDVPLEFVHALERPPEAVGLVDYGGALGLGAQESLLHELTQVDEQRARLAQEAGRALLAAARERAEAAGVARHDGRLRHGELADTVVELESDARLFVLGEHFRASSAARLHLDHRVEQVVRAVQRPVLVVTGSRFATPERFVIAFDGSPTARRTVDRVAASPLLAGLPVLVAMAGADAGPARRQLDEARGALEQAGFRVETELIAGEPEAVLPPLLKAQRASMLVMGAYGHSRIRQLVVGSTTTTLLRTAEVPALILR